mmetsp:Transcript_55579/g.119984  ORF Transcript_55579/g.119984 Transcript_55579/m.119984 type:complete len:282 (+) Transcript_55579:384-1229(+)
MAVGRVRVHIGSVGLPGTPMEMVVLFYDSLELRLYVGDLVRREAVLCHRHAMSPQMLQKSELLRHEEQQRLPLALCSTSCSTHSVDVLLGLIGRVKLANPVHLRNVEASRRHVRAEEDALLGRTKLVVRRTPGGLLFVAVDALHRHIDVVKQLIVVLHGVAGGEKDHHLLVPVSFQEGKKEQEAAGGWTNHVALSQSRDRGHVISRLHLYKNRLLQGEPREVGHFPRLSSGKERRLPLGGQQLDDLVELLLKPDLEDAIGLVNGEIHQVVVDETLRVLHVI